MSAPAIKHTTAPAPLDVMARPREMARMRRSKFSARHPGLSVLDQAIALGIAPENVDGFTQRELADRPQKSPRPSAELEHVA
jgi:hypothetical protein